MTEENTKFLSPLARARGMGSTHEGVHHWLAERISAVLLLPLTFWLIYSIISLRYANYEAYTLWLQNPLNASLLLSFLGLMFYHAAAGLQVVIEDYVSCHAKKLFMIFAVKAAFGFMAFLSLVSVLKIAL